MPPLMVDMMTASSMALITGVETDALIVMIGGRNVMIVTSEGVDLHRHLLIIENKVGAITVVVASPSDPDLDQAKEDSIVAVEMALVVVATE